MIKNLSVTSHNYSINKRKVHNLVSNLKSELGFRIISLTINFIDSETILKINMKYLNHNSSTDIITFNYSGSNSHLDGEIFISVDDADKNSKKYKVPLNEELNRLVIHGMLHLVGYDDNNSKQKKIMKSAENRLTYKNNFALL